MFRTRCLVALAVALGLTGCIAIGGSSKTYKPTVGEELVDLKAALDSGAIDQAEYAEAKQRLLKQVK